MRLEMVQKKGRNILIQHASNENVVSGGIYP